MPYPTATQFTGNYIGKTNADLGLTQQLETTTAYTQTILGIGDKYTIDLYGSLMTYKPDETPLLSILMAMGQGSVTSKAPYEIWNDEYSQTMWWDIALDTLRYRNPMAAAAVRSGLSGKGANIGEASHYMPLAINAATYKGGLIKFLPVTAFGVAQGATNLGYNGTMTGTIVQPTVLATNCNYGQAFVPANGVANEPWFAIKQEDSATIGQMYNVWNRIRQLLYNLGYKEETGTGASTGETVTRLHSDGTELAPVYMAFDELHVATGTGATPDDYTIETFYQVLIKLKYVAFGPQAGTGVAHIYFGLDLTQSNISPSTVGIYAAGSNHDSLCIGVPAPVGTPADNTGTSMFLNADLATPEYMGKISRMLFVGWNASAPSPIPEGDTFVAGGNFTAWREQISNFCQIFATKKYGITGTHMASAFRFGDDFIRTREMYMSIYKRMQEAAYMFGVKGESYVVSTGGASPVTTDTFMMGQPARTLGGLMDYALFPINYMKRVLPAIQYTAENTGESDLITWVDGIVESLAAFRHQSAKSFTFLMSTDFMKRLIPYTKQFTANNRIMGGQVNLNMPSQLTFGLQIFTFISSMGITVKFIHDPSLDYLPSLPVPYFLFGATSINPRHVLISLDTANMQRLTLRPDKIYGNIQDIGQDAFMEGMRGESTFKLRYPKNFAMIYAPPA